jgi:hypothetical protein
MMVKGDQEALSESKLYIESQEIFNYYLQCIIEFSQQFDPTETLMIIANDPIRREFIHTAPDIPVPLSYIINDLWPKLGFLPIDPENPGVALIAEFMLNELILKNSDSLEELNLQHLKELFSGEGEEEMDDQEAYEAMEQMAAVDAMEDYDEDDQYDQEMKEMEERKKKSAKKESKRPSDKKAVPDKDDKSDNYSSDSDKGDVRFMDINDLKRNHSQDKKADSDEEEAYDEDEFA